MTRDLTPLIKRCIKNDRAAQQEFYRLFYPRLMAVSLRMSPDMETAKDLLQDSYLKIFNSLKTIKGGAEPLVFAWCKRIVNNTVIDYIRKYGKTNNKICSVGVECLNIEYKEYDTSFLDSTNLTPEIVMTAINNLSPSYKPVFMMITDGYEHKQVADRLGISVGTSKSNYSRAKVKIIAEFKAVLDYEKKMLEQSADLETA